MTSLAGDWRHPDTVRSRNNLAAYLAHTIRIDLVHEPGPTHTAAP